VNTDIICNLSEPINLSQRVGQNIPYIVDVGSLSVNQWSPNASYAALSLIRPTTPNETGFLYEANAAGQSGPLEPAWATTGTVKDGSLIWTPITPPAAGEDAISSVAWVIASPNDGALVVSAQTNDARTATAQLGPGTLGQIYTINVTVTMTSGAEYVARIILAIV
jgi:hypothetical protein